MQKTRVLVVVGSLRVGGQERVAASIVDYIDKEKFQVDYLVYDDAVSDNTDIVESNGGRIIREKDSNRFGIVKKLKEIMIRFGPYDIVHSHGMFNNGYVMRAAKMAGVKCRICHSHSTNDGKNNSGIVYKFYKYLMRRYILKYSTSFVACGLAAGEYLYGSDFKEKGEVFYNRINSERFEYSEEKHLKLRKELKLENDKTFLIVGHLVPLKNHKLAFDAFEKYHAENANSKLIVLGDGEYRSELETCVANKGLSASITFLGNVKNVNEYMIAADCLLMPSWYEGLPVTLVEAQAAGLKCIVSDTVTKEVDITGLISWCPLDNVTDWVNEMQIDYEREDVREKIIENNYDFVGYADWLEKFYLGAMDKVE